MPWCLLGLIHRPCPRCRHHLGSESWKRSESFPSTAAVHELCISKLCQMAWHAYLWCAWLLVLAACGGPAACCGKLLLPSGPSARRTLLQAGTNVTTQPAAADEVAAPQDAVNTSLTPTEAAMPPATNSTDAAPAPPDEGSSSPAAAPDEPPLPASNTRVAGGMCPTSLAAYLEQEQSSSSPQPGNQSTAGLTDQAALAAANSTNEQQQTQQQQQVPVWPPLALQQGLTCTMEVSHLAMALPGSRHVCNVLRVKNNLLSVLFSWQLVWQMQSAGLMQAVGADGAVLLDTSAEPGGQRLVRAVNAAQQQAIAAQGGQASFVLETQLANASGSNGSSSGSEEAAKPGLGSLFLNGLSCTRLPLMGSGKVQDCAATEWPLDSSGLFGVVEADPAPALAGAAPPLPVGNSSWAAYWNMSGLLAGLDTSNSSDGNSSSSSSSNSNSNSSSTADVPRVSVPDEVAAALRWLSCTSHFCCGLQVVEAAPAPATATSNVTALDGAADGGAGAWPETNGTVEDPAGLVAASPEVAAAADAAAPTQLSQPASSSSNSNSGSSSSSLVAGLVGSFVGLAAVALGLVFARRWRAKRAAMKQQQQQTLQTAPLTRTGSGNSNSDGRQSFEDASSQPRSSLASVASSEWNSYLQHYQLPPPPAPVWQPNWHRPAAAQPAGPAQFGTMWRAGSWPEGTHTLLSGSAGSNLPPPPGRLFRSSSGPQVPTPPQAADAPWQLAAAAAATGSSATNSSWPESVNAAAAAAAAAASNEAGDGGRGLGVARTSSDGWLMRAASNASSGKGSIAGNVKAGATSLARSASSGLDSLRQWLGGSKTADGPLGRSSSVGAAAALGSLQGQQRQLQQSTPDSAVISVWPAVASVQQLQLQPYRQQLQLLRIQESAPLAAPTALAMLPPPAHPAAGARGSVRLQLRQQHQGGGMMGAGAAAGQLQSWMNAAAPASSAAEGQLVSRRISPIISVLEDNSSATSNDSMTPAAWHLADKQLQEHPGWLNIDFAAEVRLEKKLGEGGFGQVFRARWRDQVIAAKLVPFMSLVAHQQLPVSLTSAEPRAAAVAAEAAGLAAGGGGGGSSPRPPGADALGLGMQFSAAALRAIKMEIRVLSQLSHSNIVAFRGACLAPPHICILEELAEGGSLWERLHSRCSSSRRPAGGPARRSRQDASGQPPRAAGGSRGMLLPALTVAELLSIAADVASAMSYLHTRQPQVVHRDLKPQNVLLDQTGRAKVCDFGISKMKDASLAVSSTRLQAGTPAYMAPEQFDGCAVSEKVDVWAFGVLLWECCSRQQPWRDLSPMQIIYAVGLQKERLSRPASCPDGLWQLIEACWQHQPEERPAFPLILETLRALQQQQQLVAERSLEQVVDLVQSPETEPAATQQQQQQRHAAADEADAGCEVQEIAEAASGGANPAKQ